MLFQRLAIRTTALVCFAACLTARADIPTFSYAAYGLHNAAGANVGEKMKNMEDVTQTIREMIRSKKPKSQYKNSMNGIFGRDPIPYKVKTLHLVLSMKIGTIDFPVDEQQIDENDMNGFWKFIDEERAKKPK
jgi:hypothetical protein